MLQPIKSTQSTTATKATEPTDAVRPISEQRPGQTLQDRLYQKPEILGKKKSATPTGNETSLFAKYSVAKMLPTVPLTAAGTTAAPGTFSSFVSKYSNYQDFFTGLSSFQKPESQKEFVSDKYGTAFISPELIPYANKYGLSKGAGFLQDLYRADRVADARKSNPYWSPIMLKDMDEYFEGSDLQKYSPWTRVGKGVQFAKNWALNKSEIDTLRKVAEDNMLGQSGFEELLHRAYQQKKSGAFTSYITTGVEALTDKDSDKWGQMEKSLSFTTNVKLSDLPELKNLASKLGEAGSSGAVSEMANSALREYMNNGLAAAVNAATSTGNLTSVVGRLLDSFVDSGHQKDVLERPIRMISDSGRLKKSPEDFSREEFRTIEDFRDYMKKNGQSVPFSAIISAMQAITMSSLYFRLQSAEKEVGSVSSESESDRALSFGNGISLSKTYNPYGGRNV